MSGGILSDGTNGTLDEGMFYLTMIYGMWSGSGFALLVLGLERSGYTV